MTYIETYTRLRERVVQILEDPAIGPSMQRPWLAYLTRPNAEALYFVRKRIVSARIARILSAEQSDDMLSMAYYSNEMYESLSDGLRESTDYKLAEICAKKLINIHTLAHKQ